MTGEEDRELAKKTDGYGYQYQGPKLCDYGEWRSKLSFFTVGEKEVSPKIY